MELNYFISQSEAASQLVRDKWLDTSSAKSRSFISSEYTQLTGITGNCDFSLFFTLEKKIIKKDLYFLILKYNRMQVFL